MLHVRSALVRLLVLLTLFAFAGPERARAGRRLTFEDLMKFEQIENPVIAEDGVWIAYGVRPDRGDGETHVQSVSDRKKLLSVERGSSPRISADSRWAAMTVEVPFASKETSKKNEKKGKEEEEDEPKPGMALVSLESGAVTRFERVESFAFSDDGGWLAYHFFPEVAKKDSTAASPDAATEEAPPPENVEDEEATKPEPGGRLVLRSLATGQEFEMPYVSAYAFDETSRHLAYAVSTPTGEANGLFLRTLMPQAAPEVALERAQDGSYTSLTWAKERSRLAYLAGHLEKKDVVRDVELRLWDENIPEGRTLATSADAPPGWEIPAKNEVQWTKDGERLFFGFAPAKPEDQPTEEGDAGEAESSSAGEAPATAAGEPEVAPDPYDSEAILENVDLDVWHWNDPRILPNQRKRWEKEKDRVYRAIALLDSGTVVRLADPEVPDVEVAENAKVALAESDVPYLQEMSWSGEYRDLFLVDLATGARRKIVERTYDRRSLSPGGGFVAYFDADQWYLVDTATGERRNLTEGLDVPFANEDHDYPSPRDSYGLAGWVAEDAAVLVYDKWDVWQFPTDKSTPFRITGGQGREQHLRFRVIDLDPKRDEIGADERLLLLAYDDREKNDSFYAGRVGSTTVERLREQPKRFRFLAKAEKADRILYTEESYREFPDLWVSDLSLHKPRKISEVNPQIEEFDWGEAELVEWNSADGIPLQGVLIRPAGYEKGKRYPVLVYFYRFFSQRLHEFDEPVVNHRPSFPVYASDGYAVFLPDIRFEVGRPGLSAVKCLVPGVQKLIDMGVADPDAIGLHGHSWSGYQTAFVVTQTNIFAAAVAGAPVSNMTSAYGGIRYGTGLARQFQYEMGQSRIGGSLWESPLRYIENSPLFYADRIETPLLIEFGDEDDAVPWTQGIELYLAMRRLRKPCVLLEYRGEPHHLKKYPNKLDYSIKMKEFFDHFCKGAPAPAWWAEGVPYRGD